MKKLLLITALFWMLFACEKSEEDPGTIGTLRLYYLDGSGKDLLDINDPDTKYPVHYPTSYMPVYQEPDDITYETSGGRKTLARYSGNWSFILYDEEEGLFYLQIAFPFSNLSQQTETFYIARSPEDVDTIVAEIEFITEGIIGGGPNPRYPDLQKLYYNGVLIMEIDQRQVKKAYIIKEGTSTKVLRENPGK